MNISLLILNTFACGVSLMGAIVADGWMRGVLIALCIANGVFAVARAIYTVVLLRARGAA